MLESTDNRPGYASSAPFQVSEAVFTAIKPDRYVAIIDELIALFDRLKPSLVVVDIAQGPARDACIKSGQRRVQHTCVCDGGEICR
jgi:hypothetical protein